MKKRKAHSKRMKSLFIDALVLPVLPTAMMLAGCESQSKVDEVIIETPNSTVNEQPEEYQPENVVSKASYQLFSAGFTPWQELKPIEEEELVSIGKPKYFNYTDEKQDVYNCTSERFSMKTNPQKFTLFGADPKVLPGRLIQFSSFDNASKSLKIVPIDPLKLAPMNIMMDVSSKESTVKVDHPSPAAIRQAIGELISTQDDLLVTPSSSSYFKYNKAYTEEQAMLSLGLSVLFGANKDEVAVFGEASLKQTENRVTAFYQQNLFNLSVEVPPSPDDWFADSFENEDLYQLYERGLISEQNPMLYISTVGYGRRWIINAVHSDSNVELYAALFAAFDGYTNINFETEARYQEILKNSEITITTHGGSVIAESDLIKTQLISGSIGEYFNQPVKFSDARPLAFTLANLNTNEQVMVTEATEYDVNTCSLGEYMNKYRIDLHSIELVGDSCGGDLYSRLRLATGGEGTTIHFRGINDTKFVKNNGRYAINSTSYLLWPGNSLPVLWGSLKEAYGYQFWWLKKSGTAIAKWNFTPTLGEQSITTEKTCDGTATLNMRVTHEGRVF